MTRLAIFASGRGTNAEAIIRYFTGHKQVVIGLIVSGNPSSGAADVARKYSIPYAFVSKEEFYGTTKILNTLKEYQIDFVTLAGFVWLIPQYLLDSYSEKMINVHPALLPKFGGKGMYGAKVHEAVLSTGEKESGITIHYVNENYDQGRIIFQKKCNVEKSDSAATLAKEYKN